MPRALYLGWCRGILVGLPLLAGCADLVGLSGDYHLAGDGGSNAAGGLAGTSGSAAGPSAGGSFGGVVGSGNAGGAGAFGNAGGAGKGGAAGKGGSSGSGANAGGSAGSAAMAGAGGTFGTGGAGGAGTAGSAGASGKGGTSGSGGASGKGGTSGSGGASGKGGTSGSGGASGKGGTSSGGTSGNSPAGGAGGASGTGGGFTVGPSCAGLAATCGATASTNCCSSSVVPGGLFSRDNDIAFPAMISSFRLDTYEITVSRFRNFVQGYPANRPAAGSGANPHNPADTGWSSSWNAFLPIDQTALISAVSCEPDFATYTLAAGANETRALNCLDWYEALAFCIWDGGRLPTEAEWNYAAAGGAEQREFPWSVPPTSTLINPTYASYYDGTTCIGDGVSGCTRADIIFVGSKPNGNGRWGQADLGGNAFEWVQDGFAPYTSSCSDCANLTAATRVLRGGAYFTGDSTLKSSDRYLFLDPTTDDGNNGARCARAP